MTFSGSSSQSKVRQTNTSEQISNVYGAGSQSATSKSGIAVGAKNFKSSTDYTIAIIGVAVVGMVLFLVRGK